MRIFKAFVCGVLAAGSLAPCARAVESTQPQLEILAKLDQRPGHVTVGMDGRIYITMHPVDKPRCKLMRVKEDGTLEPYPSEKISCGAPADGSKSTDDSVLYAPLALRTSFQDVLSVIDMGIPSVPPRLLAVTVGNNDLVTNGALPSDVLTDQSDLHDLAVDWLEKTLYLADTGQKDLTRPAKPAIIVIAGNPLLPARRVLEGDPSLQPSAVPVQADGHALSVKGKPVMGGIEPMTIDPQRNWLYYGPLGEGKIYRVPLDKLQNRTTSKEDLAKSVEVYADNKPPCAGMTIDAAGNIYLAMVNAREIGLIDGQTRRYQPYLQDQRLVWPDSLSFGPDGMLYVTVNQLGRSAQMNSGKDAGEKPYLVARFKPLVMGAMGR